MERRVSVEVSSIARGVDRLFVPLADVWVPFERRRDRGRGTGHVATVQASAFVSSAAFASISIDDF